ncbi:ion transporter [Chondrinema litorale]|uniref:ion transporter n=1 Tax=Chondrinema litorale TaxID=2994555 RepID=UPI002542AE09|nr:ion transporter [Chondrinema litorale]UZR94443.1 ion transporter [Chondrinema litorale]
MNIKKKTFNILNAQLSGDETGEKFDFWITTLIVLNVLAIILASYKELNDKIGVIFTAFEYFSVIVFTLEYALRIWTSNYLYPSESRVTSAIKFIFSPIGLIDLLAILPFYLPFFVSLDLRFLRLLRLLRLLRILKLNRYNSSLRLVFSVLKECWSDMGATLFVAFILMLVASSLMYNIENQAQPESFSNIGQAFWWAVATLTTVGYGDIYPVTALGKFLSGVIAVLGIGIVALPTGILSSAFMDRINKEKEKKARENDDSYKFCPHCGKPLPHKDD